MPYGNSLAQLLCLPGKTTFGPTGQFIWSSVFALVQLVLVHDAPAANVQTVNVAPGASVANSISFVVCPEPHTGAVQEASVKLIGRVTSAIARPFFGSIFWSALVACVN
jgi:hypothetical protein